MSNVPEQNDDLAQTLARLADRLDHIEIQLQQALETLPLHQWKLLQPLNKRPLTKYTPLSPNDCPTQNFIPTQNLKNTSQVFRKDFFRSPLPEVERRKFLAGCPRNVEREYNPLRSTLSIWRQTTDASTLNYPIFNFDYPVSHGHWICFYIKHFNRNKSVLLILSRPLMFYTHYYQIRPLTSPNFAWTTCSAVSASMVRHHGWPATRQPHSWIPRQCWITSTLPNLCSQIGKRPRTKGKAHSSSGKSENEKSDTPPHVGHNKVDQKRKDFQHGPRQPKRERTPNHSSRRTLKPVPTSVGQDIRRELGTFLIPSGLKIPFTTPPPLRNGDHLITKRHSQQQHQIIEQEILRLLCKRAVEVIDPNSSGFRSQLFTIPKKNRRLPTGTEFTTPQPIYATQTFQDGVTENHLQLHQPRRLPDKYRPSRRLSPHPGRTMLPSISTILGQVSYQFRVLPFGLSLSPMVFTKMLRPVLRWARRKGIRLSAYLDDLLIVAKDKQTSQHHTRMIAQKLNELGYLIKSASTDRGGVSSPPEDTLPSPSKDSSPPTRQGMVLHDDPNARSYKGAPLVAGTTSIMEWPEFPTVNSDNGSIHRCVRLRLGYSQQPTPLAREMVRIRGASSYQLERMWKLVNLRRFQGTSMKVYCDNTTTIAYINKFGGTRSPTLMHLAQQIWTYCLKTITRLNLTYIPSAFNPADAPSRQLIRQLEWRIDQIFFQKLEKKWGPHHVDLFAHKRNHHLPRYVTWK